MLYLDFEYRPLLFERYLSGLLSFLRLVLESLESDELDLNEDKRNSFNLISDIIENTGVKGCNDWYSINVASNEILLKLD